MTIRLNEQDPLLLANDEIVVDWHNHEADGHSYRLIQSRGYTLLEAAPTLARTNRPDPDAGVRYFVDTMEHIHDDEHEQAFCAEIATLLQVNPELIKEAISC